MRRELALGLIAELVVEGVVVAGDVDEQGQHPWARSPGEATEQIPREGVTEWVDETPTPGAIVWFATTDEGNRNARAEGAVDYDTWTTSRTASTATRATEVAATTIEDIAAHSAASLLTPAEAADLLRVTNPTGSALKSDAAHRADDWVIARGRAERLRLRRGWR